MIVEAHNGLRQPVSFSATRVIVRDDMGNPIAVVMQDGQFTHVRHAGEPDFNAWLQLCGINRTTVVTQLPARTPDLRISGRR